MPPLLEHLKLNHLTREHDMKSKILIAREYGPTSVLDFVENPGLASGMTRIEVRAAGINPIDARRRMTGEFRHSPLPLTFGTEFAGVIPGQGSTRRG